MRIVSIGGGPAGLFFAILMKKLHPEADIEVLERNRHDDTFGWGVVFSDETLGNIEAADPPSLLRVRQNFAYWDTIETHYRGTCVTSTGHGFCGLSRKQLLLILQDRCRELGVRLEFEVEIGPDVARQFGDADLILAADGVNSAIRGHYAEHFGPTIDWRKCKFAWFGTTKHLDAFTFVFKETEWGLFQVHAYPFQSDCSTWIVECHEDVWRRAGLEGMDETASAAFCQELFAEELAGAELLTNRSMWRTFPTVKNATWRHGNIVLMGDAAHTAHFSIGSGTKLAMEDAIALVEAFAEHGTDDVPRVLEAYEAARAVEVLKTQKAAQTSLEWFENSARYMQQDPVLLSFNLMSRSKRITWDNLAVRDPELVARTREVFAERSGAQRASDGSVPVPMFTPFALRGMTLANRVVVSPMCQYTAHDGTPGDWHLVHLGSRAIGGAGLVITEMTNVTPDGRITPGCAGMYDPAHAAAWQRIVEFVHDNSSARIGVQLAHAGRKGSVAHAWQGDDVPLREGGWATLAPSAHAFYPEWPVPREMTRDDMDRVRDAFVASVRMAERAGFDLVELHMAHGYLLSSFLSPLSNRRDDEYGGSLDRRMRYPLEVFAAARAAWPGDKPMVVRISATDWLGDEGMTDSDAVVLARELQRLGCDAIDVSTAGNSPRSRPEYGRMYQVPFAERIRYEVGIPVMAVGAIQGADHCNTILAAERADLCCLARPHLADPYLTLHAASHYGFPDQAWPGQYLLGKPR
ncbi:MAG: bifunctional salicylyl-CoA 5-hydroxylase/oxidoreductase [Planctomycetes bacterium]|nr:bifunctional salicylyl-CoA 5-hydroxylase/oxidoreductase [Planctomycetota bacterium]MCB9889278.1 bifunctional salicylyl-CoA 5-hydroxylase/oxidoreductase [Planctomycetota bacterium]